MEAEDVPSIASRMRALSGTVRVRMTAAGVMVVGVALVVGALALVVVMRNALTDNVRAAARSQAIEVAAAVATGEVDLSLQGDEADEQLMQVVDANGTVIFSSPNVAGQPPVGALLPGESTTIDVSIEEETEFVAVAASATAVGESYIVIVARTLEDVTESTTVVVGLLLVGLPALLVVVAFTMWRIVGRALAPVEAIRREVDEISSAELFRRVPNPPGRDEISRLASTMNRMLSRLDESQARQRRFVSDASHELRSPVASIRQHAEVALTHPDRSSLGELAEVVLVENLRVQNMVEDLLLLARADERTLTRLEADVDLDDLVFAEAERLRLTTRLRVDTTAVSGAQVRGDPAHLRRMVRNLIDNAGRHARSSVTSILTEHRDGFAVLHIDDDGAGVPLTDRERIFERFVRLDEGRDRDHGGSGLGLAIVAEVAAAHRGTVAATTSPQGGARFEVRLPLSRSGGPQARPGMMLTDHNRRRDREA